MLAPLGPSPPPATAGISLNDCKTTVKVRNRAFMGHPSAFKSITIEVTSPDRKKVASIFAYQINRAVCDDGDFLCIMDADSDELATLSRVLFDKYGEVRPWLVEDELFKGTGCWGRELSRGKLVYVQTVYVSDESMRGQGLGSFALQSLLNSEHVTENDFVISWPTPVPPRYDEVRSNEQYEAEMHRAVSFYQRNGFRRIGLTQFLVYSPRLDHPSHNISPSNDAKFLRTRVELSAKEDLLAHTLSLAWATLEVSWKNKNRDIQEYTANYPLHDQICRISDDGIEQIIRAAFLEDQTSITQKDNKGFTPLHRAAESLNIIATKILLELGVQEDLLRRDNTDLKTPMMLCADQLRVLKELQEIKQGRWVICDIQDKSQPIAEDIQTNIQLKVEGDLPWIYHNEYEYFEKRSVEFYFNKGAIDEAEDALSGRSYGDQDEWLMNKKALPGPLMGLGRMGPYPTTSTGRAGPGGFGFGNMFDDDETDEDEDEDEDTDEDDIEEDDAEMDNGEDWNEEDDE
ncbi:hypothetical protein SCP_1303760 [Sparassis crispa]|uniref:Uncharacterized protein n=1 Tax=Sparassis crispa TaxID=139825 RepID=A0A401H2D9_9APHY|nr:hypothetical protein SCP_1303760 [Sparassis crispa]GBE88559.1 hypothetical protein SCP_1303760 [Sparassis crispa]